MQEQIKVINSKLILISVTEYGQLRLAIETHAREVIVPIPCEIIKAGGTIIDKGLRTVIKVIFVVWAINKRDIIKRICLELIVGFSFLETKIKNPQLTKTFVKLILQETKSEVSKDGTRSNL